MSRYNNNILSFTSPKAIELEVSETIFSKLYQRFIDNTVIHQVKPTVLSHIEEFKIAKRPVLSKYFNMPSHQFLVRGGFIGSNWSWNL